MGKRREAPELHTGDIVEPLPGIFEFEEEGERRRRYIVGTLPEKGRVVRVFRLDTGEEYGTSNDNVKIIIPVEKLLG